jgi:hypothetical protein
VKHYSREPSRPTTKRWDLGRVRFFYDQIQEGRAVDPVDVYVSFHSGRLDMDDGHHRLAAHHIGGANTIVASYQGPASFLRYFTGERATKPRIARC